MCAAIMSRAALETAASYAWLQTEIRPALEQVAQGDAPTLVKYEENGVLKDLEDKLLKVVFASRAPDAENFYNPTNIVTIIEKIAKKVPHQEAVAGIYFELCEVAHPKHAGTVSLHHRSAAHERARSRKANVVDESRASSDRYTATLITALSWSTGTSESRR